MAAIRYRLIHDYIGVNYSIACDVLKNKIPQLFIQIQEFLNRDELIRHSKFGLPHVILTKPSLILSNKHS
jgi:hypothetical protein